jgi:predicted small lipoprotein YifL
MKTLRLSLLLLSLVLLAACGTKGDLVLPDKADEAAKPEPPAAP